MIRADLSIYICMNIQQTLPQLNSCNDCSSISVFNLHDSESSIGKIYRQFSIDIRSVTIGIFRIFQLLIGANRTVED